MNIWQTILKAITFGAYDPEKKFEQEVLGEATINLEEIESLREGVKIAVGQFDKYFPNESNVWNNYDLGVLNQSKENVICQILIQSENKLQEQGKYVGMDEETRIKAILAEGEAGKDKGWLKFEANNSGQQLEPYVADAYGISAYQKYMDNGLDYEVPRFGSEMMDRDSSFSWKKLLASLDVGSTLSTLIRGSISYPSDAHEIFTEKYVPMIIANEKATSQSDGTWSTKTPEERQEIYKQREQELRDMPYEELIEQGETLEKSLKERYNELTNEQENAR